MFILSCQFSAVFVLKDAAISVSTAVESETCIFERHSYFFHITVFPNLMEFEENLLKILEKS